MTQPKTTLTLTALEALMLTAIRDSEYHSKAVENRADEEVWTDTTMDGFIRLGGKRSQAGGAMGSLVTKGLAGTTGADSRTFNGAGGADDDGGVCWITQAGLDALAAHEDRIKVTCRDCGQTPVETCESGRCKTSCRSTSICGRKEAR